MNIEHMREAVEIVLERKIDPTMWDRFASGCKWEREVVDLLARLLEDAEPSITEALAEIEVDEAEDSTPWQNDGKFAVWQLQEMFGELASLEHNEIRNRLRTVPGLIDCLAGHHYDDLLYSMEIQAWGQKAVPGPLAGLRTEDLMSRLLARTATRNAGSQTQNQNVGHADANPPSPSDRLT